MTIIGAPSALELSGNLTKFVVSTASELSFKLNKGAVVLVEQTYAPNTSNLVEIDVREIVEACLSFSLQNTTFYEQTAIYGDFQAIIDTQQVNFRVIRSGVENLSDSPSNFLRSNFLTWQSQVKEVSFYSPEWLTYYAQDASTIKCVAHFSDNTTETLTLATLVAGKAYTQSCQYQLINSLLTKKLPSYYDVYVQSTANSAQLTYIQRYVASSKKSEDEQWFIFENSLGGCDTARFAGATNFKGEHEHKIAQIDEQKEEYRVDTERKYSKNTGHLDEYERKWLLDFFPSKAKYVYSDTAIHRIVVVDSTVEYKTKDLPSNYTFTWQFATSRSFLNLVRSQSLPPEITFEVPDVGSFTLPPRLIDFPHVALSEGALIPVQDPFSSTVGATTLLAIMNFINSGGSGSVTPLLEKLYSYVSENFLSKQQADTAKKIITFIEGLQSQGFLPGSTGFKIDGQGNGEFAEILVRGLLQILVGLEVGNYQEGVSGGSFKMVGNDSFAEVDFFKVRKRAEFTELLIKSQTHVGGEIVVSPARMICNKVEEHSTFYRCYFDKGDNNEVVNDFEISDQARCKIFTGSKLKYYWRLVVGVGEDYIDLSIADQDGQGDLPQAGDNISQLGNRTNTNRQNAIIISSVGDASITQYAEINTYSLVGCERTVLSPSGNTIVGNLKVVSGRNVEEMIDEVAANVNYRVEILSSGGLIFRNDSINTTLTAKVYRGSSDITSELNQNCFRWIRTSDNPEADAVWNAAYSSFGSNVLSISGSDVEGRATFNCTVTIPD